MNVDDVDQRRGIAFLLCSFPLFAARGAGLAEKLSSDEDERERERERARKKRRRSVCCFRAGALLARSLYFSFLSKEKMEEKRRRFFFNLSKSLKGKKEKTSSLSRSSSKQR